MGEGRKLSDKLVRLREMFQDMPEMNDVKVRSNIFPEKRGRVDNWDTQFLPQRHRVGLVELDPDGL